jgi:CheY-like chemotaxis protein
MIKNAILAARKVAGEPPRSEGSGDSPSSHRIAAQFSADISSSPENSRKLRVFIFDPQRHLWFLPVTISNHGFVPNYSTSIENALEILELIHPNYYSALLINMTDANVDSELLLTKIRKHPQGILPVVALMGEDDDRESAISVGVNACIDTYSSCDLIANTLRKVLRLPYLPNTSNVVVLDHSKSAAPHMLVVDDSIVCLKIFSNILKSSGFRVSTCSSGQTTIELLRVEPHYFDIIVLDVFMPDLSGMVTSKRIREFNATVPVIVMSSSEEFARSVGEVGAQVFLKVTTILPSTAVCILHVFLYCLYSVVNRNLLTKLYLLTLSNTLDIAY